MMLVAFVSAGVRTYSKSTVRIRVYARHAHGSLHAWERGHTGDEVYKGCTYVQE